VSGYVLKDASSEELEEAIRASQRDEVFLDPAVARQITQRLVTPASGIASLSARERAVLVLVAQGLSNQAIAGELRISERTARTHVSKLLTKLDLTSRTQAALVAVREGLVQP
jgi:DNA-binding NarL/FixJ family response regulator